MPAVSVIMPAYNVEQYVEDAIRSALAQTFADFELLVVDDGSTDATVRIAEALAAEDHRVKIMRKPNGGISSARNAALRAATGRYVALLDSDDSWSPEFLASQVQMLEEHPDVAVVTGNAWFLGGRYGGQLARPCPDWRPAPDLVSILDDEKAVFIMSVFRREVYETIGGFDEMLGTNEDFDFWLRAAIAGFRFIRNDRPLGHYRRRIDSLSADEARMLAGALRVLEKTRPALANRPRELRFLDRKAIEYETRLLSAQARLALESGDVDAAQAYLAELRTRRGTAKLRLAWLMARWAPGLLSRAYQLRRTFQQPVSL